LLSLAPSTVSKHISILNQARLVNIRKDGRWHYYSLVDAVQEPLAGATIEWLRAALRADRRVGDDRKRVRRILCMDKEDCCVHYR
jgi:DNA-binding transcriptional ArsR family regulator